MIQAVTAVFGMDYLLIYFLLVYYGFGFVMHSLLVNSYFLLFGTSLVVMLFCPIMLKITSLHHTMHSTIFEQV